MYSVLRSTVTNFTTHFVQSKNISFNFTCAFLSDAHVLLCKFTRLALLKLWANPFKSTHEIFLFLFYFSFLQKLISIFVAFFCFISFFNMCYTRTKLKCFVNFADKIIGAFMARWMKRERIFFFFFFKIFCCYCSTHLWSIRQAVTNWWLEHLEKWSQRQSVWSL